MSEKGKSEHSGLTKPSGTASGTKARKKRSRSGSGATPSAADPPKPAADAPKPAADAPKVAAPDSPKAEAPKFDIPTIEPPKTPAAAPPKVAAAAPKPSPAPSFVAPTAAPATPAAPSRPRYVPKRRATNIPTPNVRAEAQDGGETVTLTIDGREVVVQKGTNVLEAAGLLEKDICHFCYHQGLSVAASCRQCLVEIEKSPKLVPSCQAVVTDGMVVHTESPAVLDARRAMLEFTLVNHPIDCPICDKAGECTLQRHFMDHDHALTRVDVPKIRKAKAKDIGEHIVLDAERCILCSRCVRFCEEIPGTSELCFTDRGGHQELDVSEGARLDNAYSVNVVDICPVGALTLKDFRFQIRAWELHSTDTTCTGCATGCAVELHSKHERAHRVVPRFDPDVNGHWMCDAGRFTYKTTDPQARVRRAVVDGSEVGVDEAIAEAARRLKGKKLAVVFSAVATNEANLALTELAQAADARRYVVARDPAEGDDILRDDDQNPNTRGANEAAGATAQHSDQLALDIAGGGFEAVVFVDAVAALSDVALAALRRMPAVCLADQSSPLSDACGVVLPAASWAEVLGTFYNRQGLLRVVRPAWRAEGDRRHRALLVRQLLVALGHEDTVGQPRDLTRKLAEKANHQPLIEQLTEKRDARPKLLRWAHTRG